MALGRQTGIRRENPRNAEALSVMATEATARLRSPAGHANGRIAAMTKIVVLLMALLFAPAALGQTADWQKAWEETLAAAKKEGKVVVVGSPDPVMRNEIIPAFQKRYGIAVEYLATGSSSQTAGRIRTERSSGIYSVDVFMSGLGTTVNVLFPEKMIDPLKPLLLLPEVTDDRNWKRGKPWFIDPDGEYIMMLFANVDSHFYINTAYVKPGEIRSAKDLLDPKWKGKISTEDPTASGTGANTAGHFLRELGPEFTKKLYLEHDVGTSRDRRQLTDWLARGIYPICLTCRTDDIRDLLKDGFKIVEVFELSDLKSRLNSSPFILSYANKAPHPNAARVFINWLAGREALQIYSRGYESPSLRTDLDESFLNPETIPRSSIAYVDNTEFKWIATERAQAAKDVRALLKP
jgi:iron(III) transport system substrate-binding protein